MTVEDMARPEVLSMARPKHGGDVWGRGQVDDYSSNVNPLGPPARLRDYIMSAADDLINYPDDSASGLKNAIASVYGVGEENVIAGAGSAELIRLFPEVFLNRDEGVLMPRPTFSEYAFGCRLMGANLVDRPMPESEGFRLDVGDLINSMVRGVKAVYVCNPNNPTGRMLPRREVVELIDEAARRECMVFLDETLLELSHRDKDVSCVAEVQSHDNLFLIRSFTKSFAMPGLRKGYGFGSREVIEHLDTGRLSWNLGTIEQRVGADLMRHERGHVAEAARLLSAETVRMRGLVRDALGYDVPMTDSYFFLCPVHQLGWTSAQFRQEMLREGFLVRDCASFHHPLERYSRFCVKTPDRNDRFVEALRRVAGRAPRR